MPSYELLPDGRVLERLDDKIKTLVDRREIYDNRIINFQGMKDELVSIPGQITDLQGRDLAQEAAQYLSGLEQQIGDQVDQLQARQQQLIQQIAEIEQQTGIAQ